MLIGLTPSFESVDLLTTVETNISFLNLVEMLMLKEQSIKSTKMAKQFPSLQELTSTQPGRPSRVEKTTAKDR